MDAMGHAIRYTLLFAMLPLTGCRHGGPDRALEVTYIGNEGFMISMGGTTLLIDALSSSEYYVSPSDTTVAKMIDGIPPFDDIACFLVTHGDADHFNAGMVSRFLLKHPAVQFIADTVVCSRLTRDTTTGRSYSGINATLGQMRTIRGERADIEVLRLPHGGNPDISNLAFLVRSNGYTFFHVGDAKLTFSEEYLRSIDWKSYNVDLLFIEYFDRSSEAESIMENLIRPKRVILMHIPPGEEDRIQGEAAKMRPPTVVFRREGERVRFDEIPAGGLSE